MNDMESDDDGVILPNSPLYAHLTEAGFEIPDTELTFTEPTGDKRPSLKEGCRLPRSKFTLFLPNLLSLFASELSKVKSVALHLLHNYDGRPLLERILECPCLDEEDQRFLTNLLEAQDVTIRKEKLRSSFLCCSILAGVAVCFVARFLAAGERGYGESLAASCVACALLFVAGAATVKRCLLRQYRANVAALLGTMQDMQAMIRKCLQIIQEAEVVARGFTLASHNVPIHRIEMNMLMPNLDPQRQCPELRRSVFLWTRELFLIGKSATLEAIESVPLEGELDTSTIYLACTAPEDVNAELFAPLGKALDEGTDNFSLSALKAMLYLMHIQLSEFLRRLSLCVMPGIKKSCLFDALTMKTIVSELTERIRAQLTNFSNAYHFYKSSQMTEELERRPLRSLRARPHELHTAAHSLGLHLQAALKRAQAVESITESIEDDADLEPLEANLSCLLAEVKAELASGCNCLEEVSLVLDKKSGRKEAVESPALELPPPASIGGPGLVVIKEEDVPVVEDELRQKKPNAVFEASVPDKMEPGDVESDDDYELPLEKKQKEASAVVFKELKSVLVLKAKEHREREKNALARAGLEGEHFDKLGFVVPESEGRNDTHVGDGSTPFGEEAAARGATPFHRSAMGDERSEEPVFRPSSDGESLKQGDTAEIPTDAQFGYDAPLPGNLLHPRNIAFLAAIRSRQLRPMEVNTFEDDVSGGSSCEDDEGCDSDGGGRECSA